MDVIANEIRRLDEVVAGIPQVLASEDLKLQPVGLRALFDEVRADRASRKPIARASARLSTATASPDVNGDPAMLRQAFLNLAPQRLSGDAPWRHAAHPR